MDAMKPLEGKLRQPGPPFIKPVRNLTADDLFYKSAPTPAAGGPENREAELLARDFTELNTLISRREEWMASETLFSGKVKCLDGDSGEIVAELVYGTPSKTTPVKAWTDPTADPLADLRAGLRLVSNQCGSSADLIVMGKNAADAFEGNPNVLNAFDKMRINPGTLSATNLSWGVISLGSYRGVTLHVYEAEYQDADGSMKAVHPRRLRARRLERGSGLLLVCGNLAGRSGREKQSASTRARASR